MSEKMPRARNSEVDAYAFIKEHLAIHGWVVKNPNRTMNGQVYTQNECLDNPEIARCLVRDRPENIVKLSETEYYVIEAKRNKEQITQALTEAEDYAKAVNTSRAIKAKVISGVAGNSTDGFLVKSKYFKNGRFNPIKINGKEITSFVSPAIAKLLLENDSSEIADLPVDEVVFLKSAEDINKILHLGAINKNYRARVMAALLLALIDDTRPNVDASPRVLINEINSRAENILIRNGKPEFFDCIKIALPPSQDNHIKFKNSLVQTIQELENLNIRSAMNSGTDVLGKFYEVFLKYGNGAKEIGIVLTPRHITRFAADIFNIKSSDIVLDPACGTGGFLVAAFDQAKKTATQSELDWFKNNGLYGVEQEPEVAALAIVNMIFRGDGKNNIIEGNCFQKTLIARNLSGRLSAKFYNNPELPEVRTSAATKILMNPPFALKKSDEKEYKFVQHALDQMQNNGLLFCILPISTMVISGEEKNWRLNKLLQENTIISVISFPPELFYPIGVYTLGIIIKKGNPHPPSQNVLWLRIMKDGFVKKKGKRVLSDSESNDFVKYNKLIKEFIANQNIEVKTIPRECKATPINFESETFELVPEVYIDDEKLSCRKFEKELEVRLRDYLAYLMRIDAGELNENN
ncbi:MAG: N-6 DNA methylase [Candidatus Diapherotrites archaeon]|nr:N-6 DNA methylase [Candidatus Diapherotrites archaeon]